MDSTEGEYHIKDLCASRGCQEMGWKYLALGGKLVSYKATRS